MLKGRPLHAGQQAREGVLEVSHTFVTACSLNDFFFFNAGKLVGQVSLSPCRSRWPDAVGVRFLSAKMQVVVESAGLLTYVLVMKQV